MTIDWKTYMDSVNRILDACGINYKTTPVQRVIIDMPCDDIAKVYVKIVGENKVLTQTADEMAGIKADVILFGDDTVLPKDVQELP